MRITTFYSNISSFLQRTCTSENCNKVSQIALPIVKSHARTLGFFQIIRSASKIIMDCKEIHKPLDTTREIELADVSTRSGRESTSNTDASITDATTNFEHKESQAMRMKIRNIAFKALIFTGVFCSYTPAVLIGGILRMSSNIINIYKSNESFNRKLMITAILPLLITSFFFTATYTESAVITLLAMSLGAVKRGLEAYQEYSDGQMPMTVSKIIDFVRRIYSTYDHLSQFA